MSARPDRSPGSLARTWAPLVAPLVLAVVVASWLLWTRADPARQGGYCVNATREISAVLQHADTGADIGRGPLPDVQAIFGSLGGIDVKRLQVRTPAAVRPDVAVLARRIPELRQSGTKVDAATSAAFARVAADYLERCRHGA